ncbi:anaphase-promoting complex, cyclosome, subunit 4-domain-containing protein [Helicostylum pulchrum]|nr:anaphase-promoting complex, cyclosome, subunit 4-domain-containing protein [Helicostylum pulchrum]
MPEVELTGTLAIGSVTETLRLFFEEYLTSQYIKQLESNVTHGYQNSLKIACEHIIPACERIQLELSKLLGFSLWTQRYGDFLETTAVEKTIHHIRQFVSHIHLFTKDLNHLSNTFQAFIKWITTVTEKVAVTSSAEFQNESSLCEDPELVLEFLNKDLIKDSLGEYFVSPIKLEREENSEKDYNSKQLVHLLANIKTSCRQMLEKPSVTFNEQMKVTSKYCFRLDGVSLRDQPRDKIISFTTVTIIMNLFLILYLINKARH